MNQDFLFVEKPEKISTEEWVKRGFQIDHETMDLVRVRNILKLPFSVL